ncbi:hypothetical protein Avbf_09986, partial [Armadillidium vulgare]
MNLTSSTPSETTTEGMSMSSSTDMSETSTRSTNRGTSSTFLTPVITPRTTSVKPFTLPTTSTSLQTTTTHVTQRNGFENYYRNRWSKVIFTNNQQYTWNQANVDCALQQKGAHLYIIHDADDAVWLANKLFVCKDYGQTKFWIGLLMDYQYKYPIWVDGSSAANTCRKFLEYITKCTLPTKYLSQGYAIQESE